MINSLKTLALACLTLIAATTMAQNINLRFTGTFTNGDYVRLDSVKVENLNRNWTETLVYPDTVLSFNQTGITDAKGSELELQSYPNPFNGKTTILVSIPQSGNVTMLIHNLAGQKIADFEKNLNVGKHTFGITLKNIEVYLLTITTSNGQKTIKLLNNGSYASNAIIYNGMELAEKRLSSQNFQVGDVLRIAGYASAYGIVIRSREVLQSQTASENFTLYFETANYSLPTVTTTAASNITDSSAVSGGNVTDSGGLAVTARGVCWDTAANPTISDSHTTDGTGVGTFTSNITGFLPNTIYHVRAYATNAAGTTYGNDITFTTMASLPTITTTSVSNITDSSAVSGGNVVDNGGAPVTARGICWDTATNPTISDNHTTDSNGNGTFTSNITGLLPNTTYHVRAYATNVAGTAYGNEITFTTMASLPTVTTTAASNITDSSVVSGGIVTNDGGDAIIARGVCWDTSHNPTTSSSHTTNGTGVGTFTSNITGLLPNTTYYVRAYATNTAGTAYGAEITFETDDTIHEGALPGIFSIGANRQVRFSKGNLQWSASGTHAVAGGGTATGTWRFAEHQWDVIGSANRNISSSYTGWIDLFGWGTSGWNSGANAHFPYSTSTSYSDYYPGCQYNNSLTGAYANADWGVYNAIRNGGNQPSMWRTLTQGEWDTLINYRSTSSGIHYAKATVNGVHGLIIVPDNWSTATYALNNTDTTGADFTSNVITSAQWATLENSGCAFLPAAGSRGGSSVDVFGSDGYYWSASYYDSQSSHHLRFAGSSISNQVTFRYRGQSVRLVQDAHTITPPTVTTASVINITSSTATCGGNVINDGGSAVTARGVCWNTSHNPTTSNSHTTDLYGTGIFTSSLHGLTAGTTYYVRAYATNATGTAYGAEITFVTEDTLPEGALSGIFSVGVNRQVHFSKGNLQYTTTGTHTVAGGDTAAGIWRFAPNQWDTIGTANRNISFSYNGWIDLFGWGTSGYHNSADNYSTNYQPFSTSTSTVNTTYNKYGYGPSTNMTDTNLTGTSANYDWGVYNAISNGGNQPGLWRTLTQAEWDTLINIRYTTSGIRYAKATVSGVPGLIIVPDNWIASTYGLGSTNISNANFNANVINSALWTTLENAGCVFLPIAGYRHGSSVDNFFGFYWSSSSCGSSTAYVMAFYILDLLTYYGSGRYDGLSVRLVHDVQ